MSVEELVKKITDDRNMYAIIIQRLPKYLVINTNTNEKLLQLKKSELASLLRSTKIVIDNSLSDDNFKLMGKLQSEM